MENEIIPVPENDDNNRENTNDIVLIPDATLQNPDFDDINDDKPQEAATEEASTQEILTINNVENTETIENIPTESKLPKRKCVCGYVCANTFCPICGKSLAKAPYESSEKAPQNAAFVCACGCINTTAQCPDCKKISENKIFINDRELLNLKRSNEPASPEKLKPEKQRLSKIGGAFIAGTVFYISSLISLLICVVSYFTKTFCSSIDYFKSISNLGGVPYWNEGGDKFVAIISIFTISWIFIAFFVLGISRILSALSVKRYTYRVLFGRRPYGIPSVIFSLLFIVAVIVYNNANNYNFMSSYEFYSLNSMLSTITYLLVPNIIGGVLMIAGFETDYAQFHNTDGK